VLALVLGTLLAVGALGYVLFPLFVGTHLSPVPRVPSAREGASSMEKEAVVALREIEFDRATGKLSDGDYDELKVRYTERALAAMRVGALGPPDDPVEAAVLAYRARLRSCVRCGPRPEPDAAYCSNCGHYLPGECASCGARVEEAGAAFCTSCGRQLAA
jgi:hypothetical protein